MVIKDLHLQEDLVNSAIGTVTGFLPQLTPYIVTESFVVSPHNSLRSHLKANDKSSVYIHELVSEILARVNTQQQTIINQSVT